MPFVGNNLTGKTGNVSTGQTVPEKQYEIKTRDGVYKMTQSQVDWISSRYKAEAAASYKPTFEDNLRRTQGQIPLAFERTYSSDNVDRELRTLGLPSQKVLSAYVSGYLDWYGNGEKYTFDSDAEKYMKNQYKATWQYNYTAEDQKRKSQGLPPLSVSEKYADSYTDNDLYTRGLPSQSEINDYIGKYNEEVKKKSRISEFNNAVAMDVFAAGGAKAVDKEQRKQMWFDKLQSPEWADVAALYKDTTDPNDIDPTKYTLPNGLPDTEAYNEARLKAFNDQQELKNSSDTYLSYDSFGSAYPKMEIMARRNKIVDSAISAAYEASQAPVYATLTDRKSTRAWVDALPTDADPVETLQKLYDNGVNIRNVKQARNRLMERAANKEERDRISAAFDQLQFDANSKLGQGEEPSILGAVMKGVAASTMMQGANQDSISAAMSLNESASQDFKTVVDNSKRAKDVRKTVAGEIADLYYSKDVFTTVDKNDAIATYKKFVNPEDKTTDAEDVEAAKEALAAMGLNNREIGLVQDAIEAEKETGAGNALLKLFFPDVATDEAVNRDVDNYYASEAVSRRLLKNEAKGEAEDLKEILGMARAKLVSSGSMNPFEFDQAVRQEGLSSVLDPEDQTKNYYVYVDSKRAGATPEQAMVEWERLDDQTRADLTNQFMETSRINPDIAKTNAEVIAQQGVASIAPKAAAGIISGTIGAVDMFSSVFSGRTDQWQFTKQINSFAADIQNMGRSNQTLFSQGVSLASDVGAEVAKMYALNAAGGAISEATGLATAAASKTASGARFLAKSGMFLTQSTPFMINAMGQYYTEAMQGGATIEQARSYGLLMGSAEGLIEAFNADKIWGKVFGAEKIGKSIVKNAGKATTKGIVGNARFLSLITSFLGEYTEEAASYAGSWAMGSAQGWNKDSFSWSELNAQGLMGGLIGLIGGAASLSNINESSLVADYMIKSGDYSSENYDVLFSTAFRDALTKEQVAQYQALGYNALMSKDDHAAAVNEIVQAAEAYHAAEAGYKESVESIKNSQKFKDATRLLRQSKKHMQLLIDEAADPASDEMIAARDALAKSKDALDAVKAEQKRLLKSAENDYASSVFQSKRAIEKASDKVRAHHVVLAGVFQDEVNAMATAVAASELDTRAYKSYVESTKVIDSAVLKGQEFNADLYDEAMKNAGRSVVASEATSKAAGNVNAVLGKLADKMRQVRAGNGEAVMTTTDNSETDSRAKDDKPVGIIADVNAATKVESSSEWLASLSKYNPQYVIYDEINNRLEKELEKEGAPYAVLDDGGDLFLVPSNFNAKLSGDVDRFYNIIGTKDGTPASEYRITSPVSLEKYGNYYRPVSVGAIQLLSATKTTESSKSQPAEPAQAEAKAEPAVEVQMTENDKAEISKMALRLGKSVEFRKLDGWIDGMYENGKIILNETRTVKGGESAVLSAAKMVLVHEMTHSIEGTQGYNDFAEFAVSQVEKRTGIDREAMFAHTADMYREASGGAVELSPAKSRAEIVARYAEENLFSNKDAIADFVEKEATIAGRFLNWIQYQIAKINARKSKDPEAVALLTAERLYIKAFAAAGKSPSEGYRLNATKILNNNISTFTTLDDAAKDFYAKGGSKEALAAVERTILNNDFNALINSKVMKDAYARAMELEKHPTHEINTPEREALREQWATDMFNMGSPRFDNTTGKYVYDGDIAKDRVAFIVIGQSGAGKSSAIVEPVAQDNKARVVDSDIIKKMIPEFKEGYGGGAVHVESAEVSLRSFNKSIEDGGNVVIPLVGATQTKPILFARMLKQKGYTTYLILNELDSSIAAKRSIYRFFEDKGRFVDPEYVFEQGDLPVRTYEELKKYTGDLFYGYQRYNNDVPRGAKPRFVEESYADEPHRNDALQRLSGRRGFENAVGACSQGAQGKGSAQYSVRPRQDYVPKSMAGYLNFSGAYTAQDAREMYSGMSDFSDQKDSSGHLLSHGQLAYFFGSEVRDDSGNLLVLYRGTERGVKTKFSNQLGAIFLTDNPDMAASYASADKSKVRNIHVYEAVNNDDVASIAEDQGYSSTAREDGSFVLTDSETGEIVGEYDNLYDFNSRFWDDARAHAEDSGKKEQLKNVVYEMYANLENPLVVDAKGGTYSNITSADDAKDYNFMISRLPDGTYSARALAHEPGDDDHGYDTVYEAKAKSPDDAVRLLEEKYGSTVGYEFKSGESYSDLVADYNTDGGYLGSKAEKFALVSLGEYSESTKGKSRHGSIRTMAKFAEQNGYDGLIVKNVRDDADPSKNHSVKPSTVVVVPRAEQIKTTTNLNPSAESEDIRYSIADGKGTPFEESLKKYAQKAQGMNPRARDAAVPEQVADGVYVSDAARSILESEHVNDHIIPQVEQYIADQKLGVHARTSNDKTREKAQDLIARRGGVVKAMEYFKGMIEERNVNAFNGADIVALGEQLLAEAAKEKNVKAQIDLISDLCILGTQTGRMTQAFAMLKLTGAVGRQFYMQKMVKMLNEKYKDQLNGKAITVDSALYDALAIAGSEDEMRVAEEAILKKVGRQIPLTPAQAWSNWRYFSMLANPVTHMRNIFGNVMMFGAHKAKDLVSVGLEKTLKPEDRTKALYTGRSAEEQIKVAATMFDRYKKDIVAGGKYGFEQEMRRYARYSNKAALDWAMRKNSELLEQEDEAFMKPVFIDAFTQYMLAQKIDPANMTVEQEAAAAKVAIEQAKRATFREESPTAMLLQQLANKGWAGQLLSEGLMPFKRTTINIAKRGIEYSPVGLFEGVYMAIDGAKTGKYTPAQAVDRIASGMVGSTLTILGFVLGKLGVLRGGGEDDDNAEAYMQSTGRQKYSIDADGVSIGLSNVPPTVIPLFLGVQLAELSNGGEISLKEFTEAAAGIVDPLMEMSFMASLNNALKSYNTDENVGGAIGGVLANAAMSYGSQYIPTLGGKIAQFADPTARTAKASKASPVGTTLDYWGRSQAKKVPVLENQLEPNVDQLGRTQVKDEFGEWALDFFNKFVLPMTVKVKSKDSIDNELVSVFEQTGNRNAIPVMPQKYFMVDGVQYPLTAKQYTAYSTEYGESVYRVIGALMNSSAYRNASNDNKALMLEASIEKAEQTIREKWKYEIVQEQGGKK